MWTNSRCHIVQGPRLDDSVNGKPLIGGKCRIMRLAREHRGESSEKLYIDAFSVRTECVPVAVCSRLRALHSGCREMYPGECRNIVSNLGVNGQSTQTYL
jgi:hypothetical protein